MRWKKNISKFLQIKFKKVQKKQTKNSSSFLVQDWSNTIFKTSNNNHAVVYIDERPG